MVTSLVHIPVNEELCSHERNGIVAKSNNRFMIKSPHVTCVSRVDEDTQAKSTTP